MCAGAAVLKAFRADPSKSIVDHLLEVSKVAEGLCAQHIDKLRDSERSLQHYADALLVHTLYKRAARAKHCEQARRDGESKLEGVLPAQMASCSVQAQCLSTMSLPIPW